MAQYVDCHAPQWSKRVSLWPCSEERLSGDGLSRQRRVGLRGGTDALLRLCLLRHDLLKRPARVLSDIGIRVIGNDREVRLAVGMRDLAQRGGGFLAQVRLLMGDAGADRTHRPLD